MKGGGEREKRERRGRNERKTRREREEEKKGGRKDGRNDRGKEERNLRLYHIYFPLVKTQAGCHSIKAIILALLAILEIKFGLLKLYTQKPVG